MRKLGDEVALLQTRSLTGAHGRPFRYTCQVALEPSTPASVVQALRVFFACLVPTEEPPRRCTGGRESPRGHSGDADCLDELLVHALHIVSAYHEDRLAQAPSDNGSGHRPPHIGELRRAGRIPLGHFPHAI
jgi:hypothetical protein